MPCSSRLLPALLLLFAAAPGPGRADDDLRGAVERDYAAHLRALFEHLHRNPELSFLEVETAARVAQELRGAGANVTEGLGGTGLVGILENGEGPTVLVRADMDGLPVKEESGLPYASVATQVNAAGQEVPVMHACGHDVNMVSMIGAARRLAALRDRWSGTVMFVGQPAEERLSGARAMLDDGLYERFGVPDYALALHVAASGPAGRLGVQTGPLAASADSVDLVVHGVAAHGASPQKGKDPVYLAAQIVIALQGLVSRELSPLEPGVVTVGSIHGGSKHNIIPNRVKLELTVRADNPETRNALLAGIERIARGVALTAGLPEELLPEVTVRESTPPLLNDVALTERLREAFVREMGEDALYEHPRDSMGAEDFAYFVAREHGVPGSYWSVGGTPQAVLDAEEAGGARVPSHHSGRFRIEPEPAVTAGVEAMTVAVLELLGGR
ncbi:MAG: amidohydrolase [Myxococcota bacterium]|nr:amidohydrolase [Myxococcota bacterium]